MARGRGDRDGRGRATFRRTWKAVGEEDARRARCVTSWISSGTPAFHEVRHVFEVEGVGKARARAGKRFAFEIRQLAHVNPNRARIPRLPQPFDNHHPSRRFLVVERVRKRPGKRACVFHRAERAPFGQRRWAAGKVGNDMKICFSIGRPDANFEFWTVGRHVHSGLPIGVVGEDVSEEDHRRAICVAPQNAQTAKCLLSGAHEAREDSVAAEKEVASEPSRGAARPKALGLDQRDRQKAPVAVRVDLEPRPDERREHRPRKCVREHERPAKERFDGKRMPTQGVQHRFDA